MKEEYGRDSTGQSKGVMKTGQPNTNEYRSGVFVVVSERSELIVYTVHRIHAKGADQAAAFDKLQHAAKTDEMVGLAVRHRLPDGHVVTRSIWNSVARLAELYL